jgi:hypothetical protein
MVTFGLVTEGRTDYIVIKSILHGYFNTFDDIVVYSLHPEELRDETNKHRVENYTGWYAVFDYCQTPEFKQAFQSSDYIIIQIDTDVSEEKHYDISKIENGIELSPEQLIEKVVAKFKSLIGEEFYAAHLDRIIFAISVHSIECWLLPLYYKDNKKSKLKSCLRTLNQALQKQEGFTIDAKNPEYYEIISEKYGKHKTLMKLYKNNPSLKIFIG